MPVRDAAGIVACDNVDAIYANSVDDSRSTTDYVKLMTEDTSIRQSKMKVSVDLFIMQILIYDTSSRNPRGYMATHSLRRAWCRAVWSNCVIQICADHEEQLAHIFTELVVSRLSFEL